MSIKKLPTQYRPYLLALILIGLGVGFWLTRTPPATAQDVVVKMAQATEALRSRDLEALAKYAEELAGIAERIEKDDLKQRTEESVALLVMLHAAWSDREEDALKLFGERLAYNQGQPIYPEAFEEALPYAKFHLLNLFLKRFDMQGGYLFTSSYPAIVQGKHVKYFAAMDQLLFGDMNGAERRLRELLVEQPENKMIKGSIAYIGRLRSKGMEPNTTKKNDSQEAVRE